MSKRPRLIFLLNSAQRRLQQWSALQHESVQGGTKVAPSAAQGGALFALSKLDGMTMGELAQSLDLAPSAVSGLVQRMESHGWIHRQSCSVDARIQRVWLHPTGRDQLPALHEALGRINAQLTNGFTEAELQTVERWLRHVQQLGSNPNE